MSENNDSVKGSFNPFNLGEEKENPTNLYEPAVEPKVSSSTDMSIDENTDFYEVDERAKRLSASPFDTEEESLEVLEESSFTHLNPIDEENDDGRPEDSIEVLEEETETDYEEYEVEELDEEELDREMRANLQKEEVMITADGNEAIIQESLDNKMKNHPLAKKYQGENKSVVMTKNTFYKKEEELPKQPNHYTGLLDTPMLDAVRVINEVEYTSSETTSNPDELRWTSALSEGIRSQPAAEQFTKPLEEEGRQWVQQVDSAQGKLNIHGVKPPNSKGKIAGAQAILHFSSTLRAGKVLRVPLWHSGFWITIKTPSAIRQAEMLDQLRGSRIAAGQNTYGRVFNNYNVFASAIALDLAYECIFASSLDIDPENIRQYVDIVDTDTIIWALAAVIWPLGFEYVRARLGDPSNESNTVSQIIRVENCQWTDTTKLTQWQRNHMGKKASRSMSLESLSRYQDEFTNRAPRVIKVNEDTDRPVSITLKPPYADDWLATGQQWINDIVHTYTSVAGRHGGDRARDDYVARSMSITELRAFSHWFSEIKDSEVVVDDRDSILAILENMSEIPGIKEKVALAVRDYIDEITISVIAIPTDDSSEAPLPRFPYLIPISPVYTFFTRLEQKFPQGE